MIEAWNRTVTNKEDVYIVGDFMYKTKTSPTHYLSQLKGHKHLIKGNHDSKLLKDTEAMKYFVSVDHMTMVKDGDNRSILCHYPLLEWLGSHNGNYHIFGHIHNHINSKVFEYIKNESRMLNAGADIIGFVPRTFEELVTLNKSFEESAIAQNI